MVERLIHFSAHPLARVFSVEQPSLEKDGAWFKPHGLWFSVEGNDDGWKSWCETEGFRTQDLAHQTEIILAPDAKVLRLSTPEDIDNFGGRWGVVPPIAGLSRRFGYCIDWPGIAAEHDGIIIAPYIYERRMSEHSFWYYPWDCASGCIWNASAVGELRPLPCEVDRAGETA